MPRAIAPPVSSARWYPGPAPRSLDDTRKRGFATACGDWWTGFGGLAAAKRLAREPVSVALIDKRNYHLFQPLLYQVATADLSPAGVAWPIRGIFANYPNVRVVLGKVEGIDLGAREVVSDRIRLPYDYLNFATGSYHSYFGHDEWARYAPGLKRIIDATEIRKRILLAFERAQTGMSEEEKKAPAHLCDHRRRPDRR